MAMTRNPRGSTWLASAAAAWLLAAGGSLAQTQTARPPISTPAAGQPSVAMQPRAIGTPGGAVPNIQPMTIHGQRAATPFWWGPTLGPYQPRRSGPIRGAYTPMGRPSVLVQPPAYPPPGEPERFRNELSYGPLPPPGPDATFEASGVAAPTGTDLSRVVGSRPLRGVGSADDPRNRLMIALRGDGDGLRTFINGRFSNERFNIGFTSGGRAFFVDSLGFAHDLPGVYRFGRFGHIEIYRNGFPVYSSMGLGSRSILGGGFGGACAGGACSYYSPVEGQVVTIDPAMIDPMLLPTVMPEAEPPPFDESLLSPLERGHYRLERGDAAAAVEWYSRHLDEEGKDAEAMRYLAVALLSSGKPAEGVAMMIMAYQTDPSLASAPILASRAGGERRLESRFLAAVGYSNSARAAKGSSAYFTAAVLAQACGKDAVSRRLLEKARAAGMDREVHRAMEAALSK